MTVTFGSGPSVSVSTPPLQAGASVDLPVAVPPQCFHPDCPFTIKVDSNSEVDESDENNNVLALEEGLRVEREAFVALFATRDQEEGMRAFLEKREPKFEGR